jgi:hypothetical protein
MKFLRDNYPKHSLVKYNAKYIIIYKKGDVKTKKHELQHAKYYIDDEYKKYVEKLFHNFSEKYKNNALKMLKKMNYPDHVLLDEFQAYYFTEKENFFGKP